MGKNLFVAEGYLIDEWAKGGRNEEREQVGLGDTLDGKIFEGEEYVGQHEILFEEMLT